MNTPFTLSQLESLRDKYNSLATMDPASFSYHSLIALLNSLPSSHLEQLRDAGIKFVSMLATHRINRRK